MGNCESRVMKEICELKFGQTDDLEYEENTLVLGDLFLKKYYAIFDDERGLMGFADSKKSEKKKIY